MSEHACKDCALDPPKTVRPAPHPGPRCATHHRIFRQAQKRRSRDTRAQRVYGLLPGEYDVLKAAQGGRCAICQVATGRARALAVDHDHRSGQVRGLLCSPCNIVIGRLGHVALIRAARYLLDPPAAKTLAEARSRLDSNP